jgi:hypothetical protein
MHGSAVDWLVNLLSQKANFRPTFPGSVDVDQKIIIQDASINRQTETAFQFSNPNNTSA